MGRKERMNYILAEMNTLDLAVLQKVKMYLHHMGLRNTVAYLCGVKEKDGDKQTGYRKPKDKKPKEKTSRDKTERWQVYRFLEDYIKTCGYSSDGLLSITKINKMENRLYSHVEMEIKRLIVDTILVVEANIMGDSDKNEIEKKELNLPTPQSYNRGKKGNMEIQICGIDVYGGNGQNTGKERKIDEIIKFHYRQQMKMVEEFKSKSYCEIRVDVRSRDGSRLAVGLSEPSMGEIGLYTNFLTGIPGLPSTAIKGVFHHFCEERENLNQELLDAWFGTEEKEGSLIFLDGIPTETDSPFQMKKDVITSHYDEYYKNENRYPIQRPPIINRFDSVKINRMALTILINLKGQNAEELDIKKIEKLFLKCIEECSFGAKGALGYGYLEVCRQEGETDAGIERRI